MFLLDHCLTVSKMSETGPMDLDGLWAVGRVISVPGATAYWHIKNKKNWGYFPWLILSDSIYFFLVESNSTLWVL